MTRIALLLPALLMLSGATWAQNAIIRDFRVVRACAADVDTLCAGLPGGGRNQGVHEGEQGQAFRQLSGHDAGGCCCRPRDGIDTL